MGVFITLLQKSALKISAFKNAMEINRKILAVQSLIHKFLSFAKIIDQWKILWP